MRMSIEKIALYVMIVTFYVMTSFTIASAQLAANNERGFKGESYLADSIDSVNLYNGNLTLTIPIGGANRVGGGLTYKLTLINNSNVWSLVPGTQYINNEARSVIKAIPDPTNNAGLGWKLSLGMLYDPQQRTKVFGEEMKGLPWLYVSPDGAQYEFYPTLHGETVDNDPNVFYTQDGSYLRLNTAARRIDFPDGQTHSFDPTTSMLVEIGDAYGNTLTVSDIYNSGGAPRKWMLTEKTASQVTLRTHTINFSFSLHSNAWLVTSVSMAGYCAVADGCGATATYNFYYRDATIPRSHRNTYAWPAGQETAKVNFLTRVEMPGNGGSYGFTNYEGGYPSSGYIKSATLPAGGRYEWDFQPYMFPDGSPVCHPQSCADPKQTWYYNVGVASKRIYTSAAATKPVGTYTYGHTYEFVIYSTGMPYQPPPGQPYPWRTITTVTSPEGDDTVNYFNISRYGTGGSIPWDYSAPYSPYAPDLPNLVNAMVTGSDGQPMYLSREMYKGRVSGGDKRRSVYVRHEADSYEQGGRSINRREAATRTIYHDDGGHYEEVFRSNFDGLGHYRSQRTDGNIQPAGNVRTITTDYVGAQPSAGQRWLLGLYTQQTVSEAGLGSATVKFDFDPANGFLNSKRTLLGNSPLAADILVTYTRDLDGNAVTEQYTGGDRAGVSYRINHTYSFGVLATSRFVNADYFTVNNEIDRATGLIRKSWDAAGQVTSFDYDQLRRIVSVQPQREPSTGQTRQENLSPDPLPDELLAETPPDELTVEPQPEGTPADSQQTDPQPWETPVEPATGETSFEAQPDQIEATATQTQQEAVVVYFYTPANGGTPASMQVVTKNDMSSPTNLTQSIISFDPFGRTWRESDLLPGGTWSTRETLYNAMGWKLSVSEYGNLAKKTQFKDFDPFGRAGRIIPPDGGAHEMQVRYTGASEIRRTVFNNGTATPADIDDSRTTVEHYDRKGLLVQMEEQSGATAGFVSTYYTYDIGNRLKEVSTVNRGATQIRRFVYDNRGLLISEQLPELGGSTIRYSNYDSMGHVGRQEDGANVLAYDYDSGGRLLSVKERKPGATTEDYRSLKDIVYYAASENVAGNLGLGKLKSETRHNYINNPFVIAGPLVDMTVTNTYKYGELGGRLSEERMQTNTGASFVQRYAYDSQGNLASQSYPECENATCASPGAGFVSQRVPRTIKYTYDNGLLKSVADAAGKVYASNITYHPNHAVNTVAHGNGVTDNYGLDPNYMPRVASVSTTGASQNWSSGAYRYDGLGNITGIGSDWYVYDKVNRVVEGTAQFAGQKKQYQYDSAGNILSVTTSSLTNPQAAPSTFQMTVEAGTNRLGGIVYDASGNLTGPSADPSRYGYDALNMLKSAPGKIYLYDAKDERVWTVDKNPQTGQIWELITLRGLNNEVLREYKIFSGNAAGHWAWSKDYIYRGNLLLSSEDASGAYGALHYHLDHLGTPRMITNSYIVSGGAQRAAFHQYFPFGEEATVDWAQYLPNQFSERLQFTGHERDINPYPGGATLDYMHARYYSAPQGKFLSIDPGRDVSPKEPQSWNLYAYVRNNPIKSFDPTGRCAAPSGMGSGQIGICIETFIAAPRLNLIGHGDNREHSATELLSVRTRQSIIVTPSTGTVKSTPFINVSTVSAPIFTSFGGIPIPTGSRDISSPGTGTIGVKGNATNFTATGEAFNGFKGIPWAPKDSISYKFHFSTGSDGNVTLTGGQHDGYPSYGVYIYNSDGKVLQQYQFNEHNQRDLEPPMEIFVRPTLRTSEDDHKPN